MAARATAPGRILGRSGIGNLLLACIATAIALIIVLVVGMFEKRVLDSDQARRGARAWRRRTLVFR
jgi:hypothetical protein